MPARNIFTARGWHILSAWYDDNHLYSILQLYLGNNFINKLEVVSALNTLNIGAHMYRYNNDTGAPIYTPTLYLGTSQTIATGWIWDGKFDTISSKIPGWPQNFQGPQKGEANL